jgi:GDP-4-dehydro-6-deoxy-D-mannose reductase
LITGITGMAGSHLAECLVDRPDVQVFGSFRWRSNRANLGDLADASKLNVLEGKLISSEAELADQVKPGTVTLVECELQDAFAVQRLIGCVRPDRLFHLAAQSFVPTSWAAPAQTISINVQSQVNLFEAIRQARLDPLIHVAGSSEEYGLVYPDEAPIKESNPLRPLSPYAVSKVTQEMLATQYYRSYGLKNVVTRAFNHEGPRRGEVMVTSNFAKQLAEIEAGVREPVIEVGNLTARRDWSDVRDMVRAYWLTLEHCQPGEVYNIGTGSAVTVRAMLDMLLELSTADVKVIQVPSKMRPSDVELLQADASKFKAETGWEPVIPLQQTLRDTLDYWRARVGAGVVATSRKRYS